MNGRIQKKVIALVLVVVMIFDAVPITVQAQNDSMNALTCNPQTGMSSIYEYETYDIGKAGTAYVNTYLTTLHLQRSDLSLNGSRLPVDIIFYYDQVNFDNYTREQNPFGKGWMTAYHQTVIYDSLSSRFIYKNENGTLIYFEKSNNVTDDGKEIWIEQTSYGVGATGVELHLAEGVSVTDYSNVDIVSDSIHYIFDSKGRLVKIQSGVNQVKIEYVSASQYKIQKITDAVGRQYCFYYSSNGNNGTLTEIVCKTSSNEEISSGGVSVAVTYKVENGLLLSVTQNDQNEISYTYSENGYLLSASNVDACGYLFEYSSELGCVTSVTKMAAIGSEMEERGSGVTFAKSSNKTTITDHDNRRIFSFDGCGRVSELELQNRNWNIDNEKETVEQYSRLYGIIYSYGYVTDEDGIVKNVVIDISTYGTDGVTKSIYGDTGITITEESDNEDDCEETESDSHSEIMDEFGNLISSTHTEGNLKQTTIYTYSDDGNYLTSMTDENGNTEQYIYDANTGVLNTLIDGNGSITNYYYNATRELINAQLNIDSLIDTRCIDAEYTYDQGRLTELKYGNYNYNFNYDVWGNVLSVRMNNVLLVSYDYGNYASDGRTQKLTYGNGQSVYYGYNALGQIESVGYDINDIRFRYIYDSDGSLSSILDCETGETIVYSEYGYELKDADGTVLYSYVIDDEGNCTETIKDKLYQENKSSDSGLITEEMKDSNGNIILTANTDHDVFNRIKEKNLSGQRIDIVQNYGYDIKDNGNTGSLISNYSVAYTKSSNHQTILSFSYEYDGKGNITNIYQSESGSYIDEIIIPRPDPDISVMAEYNQTSNSIESSCNISYQYDAAGQIKEVIDGENNRAYCYNYDSSGNIKKAQIFEISSSGDRTLIEEKNYEYTDGILRSYTDLNGTEVSYLTNNMGSTVRIEDGNKYCNFEWGDGRSLVSYSNNELQADYLYNADGLRISKSIEKNGIDTITRYIWGDYGLVAAITGNQVVRVLYDADNEAAGFSIDDENYYYIKNLQGDVIRVVDENGDALVCYSYDPWGVPIVSGNTYLASINPCSYRGYYYDWESGYYYLQSRYYDPEIGRFLNTDEVEYLGVTDSLLSLNLFTYCENNPIASSDPTGNFVVVIAGFAITITAEIIIAICLIWIYLFSVTHRKEIQRIIRQMQYEMDYLMTVFKDVVKTAKAKPKLNGRAIHHIVARNEPLAALGRIFYKDVGLDINSPINLVNINQRFHLHIHTVPYFTAVNLLVMSGYSRGQSGVIAAVLTIKAAITIVDKTCF